MPLVGTMRMTYLPNCPRRSLPPNRTAAWASRWCSSATSSGLMGAGRSRAKRPSSCRRLMVTKIDSSRTGLNRRNGEIPSATAQR